MGCIAEAGGCFDRRDVDDSLVDDCYMVGDSDASEGVADGAVDDQVVARE